MKHMGTQTIKTVRLTLRRFALSDAEAMYKNWASDARVTRFLSWTPHESVETTRTILKSWCALYRNHSYYHWVIEWEGQIVGAVNVVRQSDQHQVAELGYCLGHDFWGRGITAEAVRAVTDYLFAEVGMHRVEIHHATDNPASGRVAEKCGLVAEGILRGATRIGTGEFKDIRVWGILREEWEARQKDAN